MEMVKKNIFPEIVTDEANTEEEEEVPNRALTRNPIADRIPADAVTAKMNGPLKLIGNDKETGKPPRRRAHLVRRTGKGVCGYKYNIKQVGTYEHKEDWNKESHLFQACWGCFRIYKVPEGWNEPDDPREILEPVDSNIHETALTDDEKSNGSSDSTSTDPDSDSDAEKDACAMPKKENTPN